MMTLIRLGLSLLLFSGTAHTEEIPRTACSGIEFRELDFWVGTWNLSWDEGDGSIARGTNRITRDEYGDCVIYERFSSDAFVGMSVSTYHAPTGVWRQTWVDDAGSYFALTGGPSDEPGVAFELRNTRLSDSEPQLRMIWENVSAEGMTWRWQGRAADAEGDTVPWTDRWVITYRRAVSK